MDLVDNYSQYLNQRLASNELIVSLAERDGVALLDIVPDDIDYYVLNIGKDHCSWYKYHSKNGRMRITKFVENKPHKMYSVIPDTLMTKDVRNKWKSHFPFFSENDRSGFRYDESLSGEFPIDENKPNGRKIKDFLTEIKDELKNIIEVPAKNDSIVFLKSEVYSDCHPFLYVLQHLFGQMRNMPEFHEVDVKNKYDFPKVKVSLSPDNTLNINELFGRVMTYSVPLDNDTLNRPFVDKAKPYNKATDVSIGKILPNVSPDYEVGNIKVKLLKPFRIDVDGYQNVFVTVADYQNNKKKTLIYSQFQIKEFACKKTDNKVRHIPDRNQNMSPSVKASAPNKETVSTEKSSMVSSARTDIEAKMWVINSLLLKDLRVCIKSMYEAAYPDQDWFVSYKCSFKEKSEQRRHIENNEREKLRKGLDLIGLIDWSYMFVIFTTLKEHIMLAFKLDDTEYFSLKNIVCSLAKRRHKLAHIEGMTKAQIKNYAADACLVAETLKLSCYHDLDRLSNEVFSLLSDTKHVQ